ncbi:MAG: ATP-binding cassette domain-containing protein [Rhodospirillales bacterium]|nr:ATP-binding cassette domain-containing protein [Rhodospirillales bacterium]
MAEAASRTWRHDLVAPLIGAFRDVAAFSLGINVLALAVPVFILQVYDRVVFHAGMSTLQGLVAGMTLALVFDFILRQARARILQTLAVRVDVALGRHLFAALTELPLRTLERTGTAEWSTCFRDIDTVRAAVSGSAGLLVCEFPFMVLAAILIFVIAAPIAWILLLVVPLMALLAWGAGAAMVSAGRRERASIRGRDALLAELIAERTTIKQLACAPGVGERWQAAHADAIVDATLRGGRSDTFSNLSTTVTLSTTVLLTTAGALAILDQSLSIGALVAVNMLSGRLLGPLSQLIGGWRSLIAVRLSLQRLGAILDRVDRAPPRGRVAMTRPGGAIALEDVAFAFNEGEPAAVAGISLRFPALGVHAITGANGSGKSTLLRLIRGLYRPIGGRVTIDGADISQFADAELAQWIAYLPQGDGLLAGSIRDNIALRAPEADDEAIVSAAARAGLDRIVAAMPGGYATEVGEAGRRLSAGQRQRIVLARALLGDPAIVLLDEPSAHLDGRASEQLGASLQSLAKSRPVLVVTHNPLLLAAADTITRLDAGTVALAGPSADILPILMSAPDRGPRPTRRAARSGS